MSAFGRVHEFGPGDPEDFRGRPCKVCGVRVRLRPLPPTKNAATRHILEYQSAAGGEWGPDRWPCAPKKSGGET